MNTHQVREDAVEAVLMQERLISEVAQSYDISKRTLYNWVMTAKKSATAKKSPSVNRRAAELKRSRRELERSLARLDAELASLQQA